MDWKSEFRLLMPLFGAKMFSVNYMNCYSNFYKLNYIYVQVRGPKYVVRLFAHEVADVEPVLGMLAQQNPQDHEVYNYFVWQLMVFLQPIIIAPSWMIYIYFFNDLKLPFHAPVVQTLDSAIHQINHCLMDKHNLAKPMCYSMDRDFCSG